MIHCFYLIYGDFVDSENKVINVRELYRDLSSARDRFIELLPIMNIVSIEKFYESESER